MAIALSFDDLSEAEVAQAQELLAALIEEDMPGVNATKGVLHDIVVAVLGIGLASLEQAAGNQLISASLAAVTANPELADDATVDALVSNFNIVRSSAVKASGKVRLVLSSGLPVNLPAGVGFVINGARYATQTSFAGRSPGTPLLTDTDRELASIGQGKFAMIVDVLADEPGPATVKANDRMTPDVLIANFIAAYADGDFYGGRSAQTNAELLAQIPVALAGKAAAGEPGIIGTITTQFPEIIAVSVVGYKDPEMRRHHALLPGGSGSRIDVYVRTATLPVITTVARPGVLLSNGADNGIWQLGVLRDSAPGWYNVVDILEAGTDPTVTGVEPNEETRAVDITGSGFKPDLETAEEAAYTTYQTAVMKFDHDKGTVGDSKSFNVRLRHMPNLQSVNDYVIGKSVRPRGTDILVKAPTPCDVAIDILVTAPTGSTVDTETLKRVAADWINKQGFIHRLSATAVSAVISPRLPAGAIISRVWVNGTIRRPDGERVSAGGPHELAIPDTPETGVSPATTCFFADPSDILLQVRYES